MCVGGGVLLKQTEDTDAGTMQMIARENGYHFITTKMIIICNRNSFKSTNKFLILR